MNIIQKLAQESKLEEKFVEKIIGHIFDNIEEEMGFKQKEKKIEFTYSDDELEVK